MNPAAAKRLLVVWLSLSVITLGYLTMDRDGVLTPSAAVTASAIVMALGKVYLIVREFMEVRKAPAWLSRLTTACVIVMGVSLLGSYFLGMAIR